MLTATNEAGLGPMATALQGGLNASASASTSPSSSVASPELDVSGKRGRLARMLRIEWLGQTAASLCWIASVFAYGITSTGDWLQLGAASAWLLANIAAVVASEAD